MKYWMYLLLIMPSGLVLNFNTLLFAQNSGTATQSRRLEQTQPMQQAALGGVELEYDVRGTGETVVLIHAGVFADWYEPLFDEPALINHYRIINYHRVGYAGSTHIKGSISLKQQATHLRLLMRHAGISRAHIVGHSSGGNIALQLALDVPGAVQSIVLLEPALPASKDAEERAKTMAIVFERYRMGDKAGAIDGFMKMVAGPDYRVALDRSLPNAFDQAIADADTFFSQELPALRQWSFTREDASRISQPVLAVIGEKNQSSPVWTERQETLLAWLPNAKPFVLPNATHLLHVENAKGMSEAMAAFFAAHPLSTTP